MNVTTIRFETPDLVYLNTVSHECTCGEFLEDIIGEARKFRLENKTAKQVDVYWHLDEYCDKKYARTNWQIVSLMSILELSERNKKKGEG